LSNSLPLATLKGLGRWLLLALKLVALGFAVYYLVYFAWSEWVMDRYGHMHDRGSRPLT
jgi:hypothetical protein